MSSLNRNEGLQTCEDAEGERVISEKERPWTSAETRRGRSTRPTTTGSGLSTVRPYSSKLRVSSSAFRPFSVEPLKATETTYTAADFYKDRGLEVIRRKTHGVGGWRLQAALRETVKDTIRRKEEFVNGILAGLRERKAVGQKEIEEAKDLLSWMVGTDAAVKLIEKCISTIIVGPYLNEEQPAGDPTQRRDSIS